MLTLALVKSQDTEETITYTVRGDGIWNKYGSAGFCDQKKKILHTPASVFGLYCEEGDKLNNTSFMLHI